LTALLLSAVPALAQQPLPTQTAPGKGAPTSKTKAATPKAEGGAPTAATGGESGLRQRVEQLEEQLVDMNVVIGTLESLAKSGGAAAAVARAPVGGGSMGASDAARLDGIETQIRALTSQVEQLAEQMRTVSREPRRSDAGGGYRPSTMAEPSGMAAAPAGGGFGTTAVTAPTGDPIGSLIAGGSQREAAMQPPASAGATPGAVTAAPMVPPSGGMGGEGGNPKQIYETAYGYLLQQDYGAAESAFEDFLKRFPNDSLAGNAQYWLGESFFVRGQYKQAAASFLKGYQTYGKGSKAPDSLVKLAMSLDRLGQKEAACSSYGELNTRFPTAPAHIKSRAQSERQRLACS
jgi:tol-pal system protein YbgF